MDIHLLTVAESQSGSWMDYVAIAISLVSLLVTIVLTWINYRQNQKLKEVDLEASYFTSIYQDYLCNKIPQARGSLEVLNGKVEGDQPLIGVLNEMRRNSAYFRYADESFYERVTNQLQAIEDYVVEINNGMPLDSVGKDDFAKCLTDKLQKLYQLISQRYHGKKA